MLNPLGIGDPTPPRGRSSKLLAHWRRRLALDIDPALRPGVADEQLQMVLGHTRIGTLVATAFAVFLALQWRGVVMPAGVVDVWLLAKLAVAGSRIFHGVRYERLGRLGQAAGPSWRNRTDLWLVIDGAVWGTAGFALMSAPIPLAALAGAVMACVSCVATFGLQFSKRSTAAYVLPILAPTALGLLWRGDEFGWIGGIGLLMLLALLLATAVRSERRLAEGLLLRLRAQALAHEKDEALKLALRQSAVKTQFLGNISHELRTPLHGILGLARLLHLEAHDSAVARRVELIESSGTHLLGLINDLLDISRLEAGRFAMRSERFELVTQIENLAGVYSVRAEDKGLAFKLRLGLEPPCWVTGDPARLRQVLHNLLGNAVKFTQRGTIVLNVTRDPGDGQFSAVVTDTGPGIPQDELAHIFEAFRQAGNASARPFEGAGLGLTIARDIAQAMGGEIDIESSLGVGTTLRFTARLPGAAEADMAPAQAAVAGTAVAGTAQAAGAPAAPAAAAQAEPQPSNATHKQRQVLIAEDDEVNALIALAYLEHFGMHAERVHNGKEAVRHALREVNRPDLVLMDCRMPVMDGLAATREIRAQERTLGLARVPVVALTATASDSDRQQCLSAGMDDFLSKPYSREELSAVLARWTQQRAPAGATG
jgi:signal transduction histidine kinase/ActR/RegA family two-component response regulator